MIDVISLLWALFALAVFLIILKHPEKLKDTPSPVLVLLTVGLFLRLIPAFVLVPGSNHDIASFQLVGQHVLRLEDVYTAEDTAARYPYLPLQLYWSGICLALAGKLSLPFESLVRLLPIAADMLISLVIFGTTRAAQKDIPPLWAGLLYAVNPIAIYVSAYHGQFDALPLLFMLLALLSAKNEKPRWSGFWLGLGILAKSWPVLALPLLFLSFKTIKQKIWLLLLSALAPAGGILVYSWLFDARIQTVIKRAISYNHGIGAWGYTYLLRVLGLIWPDALPAVNTYFSLSKFVTLLALFLVWYFVARKQDLLAGMLTILVALMAFFHAFSIQYLVWLVPFAILDGQRRWLKLYTLAAFSYMFLAYHTLILHMTITQLLPAPEANLYLIIPAGLAAWLVLLAWTWERVNVDIIRVYGLAKRGVRRLANP